MDLFGSARNVRHGRTSVTAMSNSPSWSSPPSFSNASRGYWGYEVDRLIDDLKSADLAGEPMGPIIAARELSEVGFGYNTSEVDSYLESLSGDQVIAETSTLEGAVLKRAAKQRAERQSSARQASPEPDCEVLEAHVPGVTQRRDDEGNQSWSGQAGAMLAEIHRARMLPAPEAKQTGYDAREVDQFLAQLSDAIKANQSVTGVLQNCRLKIARRGTSSYEVAEVDSLLDRLEVLSSTIGSASLQNHTANRSVRSTDSVGVKLTKTPRRLAIFIFVIVAFLTVLVVPTIFFSVIVPIFLR